MIKIFCFDSYSSLTKLYYQFQKFNITTNLNRYPRNILYNFSYFNFLFMAKYEDESDRKTNGISELFKTNGISDLNT